MKRTHSYKRDSFFCDPKTLELLEDLTATFSGNHLHHINGLLEIWSWSAGCAKGWWLSGMWSSPDFVDTFEKVHNEPG